jgi:ubiquitin C-terminal hydrolase
MWSTDDKAVKPVDLINNLRNYAPQFTQGNQEDCQEFLIFLLDIIHEVCDFYESKSFVAGFEPSATRKN